MEVSYKYQLFCAAYIADCHVIRWEVVVDNKTKEDAYNQSEKETVIQKMNSNFLESENYTKEISNNDINLGFVLQSQQRLNSGIFFQFWYPSYFLKVLQMIEKHVQHLIGVAVFLCCVLQCNTVGTRDRLYSNGTSTKCMGIKCPKNHIFKPCTEGDGIRDSCIPCPSDRPVSIELFNSSQFSYPPVFSVCKNPTEECTCTSDEAEVINQAECYESLKPICRCKTEAGYFGTDPNLCKRTKVKNCPPGYYLSLENGVCLPCGHNMYKDTIGFEECIPQPECKSTEVVLFNGNSAKRRTCRSAINIVTTPELPYQNMTTQGLTKDGQHVSSVPQPTGYNETTTTKQQ
ncbi:unnamed protein product [Mytilus coruscus]|uniref:Tyrosine-protein kinase ephrin type A/B receptor-like domain-containing protein n=1 Tax=Mytilus coruscus TaxID=42192 RepID=A0A6J8C292_MYTCO|nr:unnamed protein product [Mytilus coruscus]